MTLALGDLDREATELRSAYSLAYALAFVQAEGSMDIRRYLATIATAEQSAAADAAECSVRDKRSQVRAVEKSIDVARSVGALVKAEMNL